MQRAYPHSPLYCLKIVATGLIVLMAVVSTGLAQSDPVRDILRYRIEALRTTGELSIGEQKLASTILLPLLYEKRQFELLWTDGAKIETMIQIIAASTEDGLAPEDYHHSALVALEGVLGKTASPDALVVADRDMLLTDALILLTYHLVFGKVDPQKLDPNWNLSREIDHREGVTVLEELLQSPDLAGGVERLRPQRPIYGRLKTALARLRAIAAGGGWPAVPPGETLKKGMQDPRINALRQRLRAGGELAATEDQGPLFDASLEAALVAFQRRHGLDPDGAAGKQTLEALNVPVETRIDQLRANLERARWALHALQDRFVLVDIAGFHLYYFDDDRPVWTSRVQVGKPYRQTPIFRDNIRYVEINPTWTVPPTILARDILPAVKKDPRYLKKRQLKVLDARGRPIDPATIPWSRYPAKRFPYILRQDPGPDNALGRIKIMFPNSHMVYLHDTPSRNLFASSSRAFSSGCIRVEHPFELAQYLLNEPDKWNQAKFKEIVATNKTQVIYLKTTVPVLLLYWTVHVDENGGIDFKEDIYGRDPAVIEGLKARLTVPRK